MDKTDKKLILELQVDGRLSYAELAKRLKTSVPTVSRRVENLRKKGVISIVAIPDPKKIGLNAMAIMALDVNTAKIDEVSDQLCANPRVHFVTICFGRYDIILGVYAPTSEWLADFVKREISNIPGVKQVETFYMAELKKRTFGWLTEDDETTAKAEKPARKRAVRKRKKTASV